MSLVAPAPESTRRPRLLELLHTGRASRHGYAAALILPGLVTLIGVFAGVSHEQKGGRLYLLAVALVAFAGGLGPALLATAVSFAGLAYYFTPPGHTFTISDPDQLTSLGLFVVAAVIISELLRRREAAEQEAAAARERAEQAEAATRHELALQNAILEAEGEASDDAILLVSPEGRILSYNRRFVDLWRIPKDVIESRSDAAALKAIESSLVAPQEFYERVAYLYANPNEHSRDEIELIDGRILERFTAPVRNPAGGLYGRVWYFREITEVRRGEEIATVLAAASDLLASTSEIEVVLQLVVRLPIPRLMGVCAVYLLAENGKLRLAAVAHADPSKEHVIRKLHDRYPPEAPDPLIEALETRESVRHAGLDREALRRFARDEEHLGLLEQIAVPAGMLVPLVAHGLTYGVMSVGAAPPRSAFPQQKELFAEELARRIAIALDNARLYADAERRGDAARSLAHVGDGVVLLDREGRLRYWNPAAARLLGLASADMGRPVTEAFADWNELAAQTDGSGGGARTLPVQLDGAERWLSVSAVGFDDGSVYALRDVTEERTLEGMRAEFVTTASHELRTPLTAVYGAARTLLREDIGFSEQDRRVFLGMIASESERLASIVDAILLAGSLESGTLEIAREPCDVVALAESVVESTLHRLPEHLSLAQSLPGAPLLADCDEEKLRQVLVNLVDNAIKYSPDGGEVELVLEGRDGSARFAVRDRGLGIPAGQRERVFDKFFRLDPNLRRGIGGTGLGLYICRELVRRMDGRIWADGRAGGGSIFYVELPASSSMST